MDAMRLPEEFNHMIKFLLIDVKTCIKINGSIFEPFKIKRGMKHCYSLASYLFLMVVEVLNIMVMKETNIRLIKGIHLFIDNQQQNMVQYANLRREQ